MSRRAAGLDPSFKRYRKVYPLGLENPAPRKFSVSPVSKLGLLVYEPASFVVGEIDSALLTGGITWIEIQRNDKEFFDFLKEVKSSHAIAKAALDSTDENESAKYWRKLFGTKFEPLEE